MGRCSARPTAPCSGLTRFSTNRRMGSSWEKSCKSFYKSGLVKFFLFKICRCKPGPRELVAGLMKRYCPSNFVVNSTALHCNVMNLSYQPFQLAIAQGIVMFHGPLIRHLTSGKAPVSILVSEDNGKAQVESFFCFVLNFVLKGQVWYCQGCALDGLHKEEQSFTQHGCEDSAQTGVKNELACASRRRQTSLMVEQDSWVSVRRGPGNSFNPPTPPTSTPLYSYTF